MSRVAAVSTNRGPAQTPGTINRMPSETVAEDPLEAALADIVSSAVDQWDRFQGELPDLLYHYTDVAGLIGICSSQSLWATNLRFMNDAKELAHTWALMLDVLTEVRARATSPAQLKAQAQGAGDSSSG